MQKPTHSVDTSDVIHLLDYLYVIVRRRKIFVISFIIIFLAAAAYTFLMKPVYEATSTLRVKEEKSNLSIIEELTIGHTSPVNTEIEILKSRTIAEKVVRRLHLDVNIEKLNGNMSCRFIEIAADSPTSSYILTLKSNDAYEVSKESGVALGSGKSGVLFQENGLTILIDELQGKPGDRLLFKFKQLNEVVEDLRDRTKAQESPRLTNIIKLTYRHTDPEVARDVANNLVIAYLEKTIAFKTEEASRTVEFLEDQIDNLKKDLDVAERNLESFKRSTGVVQLDAESQEMIRQLSDIEKDRAATTLQKKQAEFALLSLKDAMNRHEIYSPSVFRDDPLISGLAARMSDLEVQKEALLVDYTADHPSVRAIQEQIDGIQKKILSTYETSYNNLVKHENDISRQIAEYEAGLKQIPARERELVRLTRLFKVNADIYTFLLQKREEARIAKASTISNVDIVDPAIKPEDPVKPQKVLYLIVGCIAGIMMGTLASFFVEHLDNTVKDAEIGKRELQIPLLGVVPYIPSKEEEEKEKHTSLIVHYEPKSSVTEAFRSLRTSVHFSGISQKRQVLMITSSIPYEGKTTIVGNLAIVMSQAAERVLLMDCDLRRPSLHKLFGHSKSPGLTELLAGDDNIESVIHNTGIPGLDFVSAGTTPPNPAELLGSDKMKNLIHTFRGRYDTILIDTPPLLVVTDTLLLSSLTDMVLLILELGRVPIKAAIHSRDMIRNLGASLAGFVLNDKSEQRLEKYGYYGERYYRYGYYGYYGYSYYDENPLKQSKKETRSWWKRLLKPR